VYHKGHKEFHLQILRILCVKNFGAQKPHFHHISSMHKAIQIVALQKKEGSNSFNTKDTKRITKDTKNFLCRFCRFFALKILEHKTSFPPYIFHAQSNSNCRIAKKNGQIHLTQRAQSVSQRTQRISFADFADSLR
jgi:hypothetical protein